LVAAKANKVEREQQYSCLYETEKIITKKQISIFFLLTASLLMVTCALVSARSDFTASSGNPITGIQIDGVIGSEWDDASKYSAAINPSGIADVWTKNDGSYIYLAIRFTADSNNPWVAVQLGASFCMSTKADGALFGHDDFYPNGYVDISFGEPATAIEDSIQNGVGAISVSSSNVTIVELKKPLNSGDTVGKDIAWSLGNTYAVMIMWNTSGEGSSEGSTTHYQQGGTRTANTLLVSSSRGSDFKSFILITALAFIIAMIGVTILAIRLRRRNIQKHSSTWKSAVAQSRT
jgi:hypothetical protein